MRLDDPVGVTIVGGADRGAVSLDACLWPVGHAVIIPVELAGRQRASR
jgi:hypothetical protein